MNSKLYYKYMMLRVPFVFVSNFFQRLKSMSVLTPGNAISLIAHHKRFSSPFYVCQLSDMFAYETPTAPRRTPASVPQLGEVLRSSFANVAAPVAAIVVYNFHSFLTQDRLFVFATESASRVKSATSNFVGALSSISELFMSANWLERELSELSGLLFGGKRDLRNLMLQFGDITAPFRKMFPSIGLRDMYYDPSRDTLTQSGMTVQS